MSIQVSRKAIVWIRTATTVAGVILLMIGLAGVPDDLVTWRNWLSWLQSGVPWWAFLFVSAVLILSTWVPRLRIVFAAPATEQTADENTHATPTPLPANQRSGASLDGETKDLQLEVDRLRTKIAALTALPDRVIGLLAAGRPLSLRELQRALSISDGDRDTLADLEACLGVLGSRRIVEHDLGSVESYSLTKDWQERAGREWPRTNGTAA